VTALVVYAILLAFPEALYVQFMKMLKKLDKVLSQELPFL
jgi:hypothetical protein